MDTEIVLKSLDLPTDVTVDLFLNNYDVGIDIKKNSKVTYRKYLTYFFKWLESKNVSRVELRRRHILEYKALLEESYEAHTINTHLAIIKRWCNWAFGFGVYEINPNREIKNMKIEEDAIYKHILSTNLFKRLLESIKDSLSHNPLTNARDYSIINLMGRRAFRRITICRFLNKDLSDESGKWVIYPRRKGRDTIGKPIVLGGRAYNPIHEYIIERDKECRKRGILVGEDEPLFISVGNTNFGRTLNPRSVSRLFEERKKAIGIYNPKITAHSLRHSSITWALEGGATLQEVKEFAGHKNIQTTLKYAHNLKRLSGNPERIIDSIIDNMIEKGA